MVRRLSLLFCCAALLAACGDIKKANWENYVSRYTSAGKLRVDRSPEDAPVTAEILAKNFELIAFGFENDPLGLGKETSDAPMILRRWESDIVYSIVGWDLRTRGLEARVLRMADRLTKHSGRTITKAKPRALRSEDDLSPNVLVLLGDDAFFDYLATPYARNAILRPGSKSGARTSLDFVNDWHGSSSPCAATMFWRNEEQSPKFGEISFAVVAIRTDLGDRLLQACIEEELAQIMGLPNDNAEVRPSVFNDDQEFSLLTDHDALLLRTLYDDRLQPGMPVGAAIPLVRKITAELLSGKGMPELRHDTPNTTPVPSDRKERVGIHETSVLAGRVNDSNE